MKLRFGRSSSRTLEWTASHSHVFDLKLRRPWFPPFFATSIFLPRFVLSLTNQGEVLRRSGLQVDVMAYDGPIGSAPSQQGEWTDTQHEHWDTPWKPGETRKAKVVIKSRNLPKPGTYIVRFSVVRYDPMGAPYKDFSDTLKTIPNLSEDQHKALLDDHVLRMKDWGIDPYTPQTGSFKGKGIFKATIIDYFRVESVSDVLNFGLVVATLGLVLATLLLAVLGL